MRALLLFLLLTAAGLGVAVHQSWIRIPPNWVPWGEVTLEAPPSWFARLQINSLAADGNACRAALGRTALEYKPISDRPMKDGCGLSDVVEIRKSQVPYNKPFQSTCALMADLYWYEQKLNELAGLHLGARLVRIDHLGTYACRNINDAKTGRRSQHATANAIDIAGFQFDDGSAVTVLRDWGKDTPQGRFLAAAHGAGCTLFNTVLGPGYNALHRDHFHLDLGRIRMCR